MMLNLILDSDEQNSLGFLEEVVPKQPPPSP